LLRTIPIVDAADPRVADYRAIERPLLAVSGGYFVAEGRFVVERLVATPSLRVRSLLLNHAALAALERTLVPLLSPDVPIYVADQRLFEGIAGFNIHRGCLALADRPPEMRLPALLERARTIVVVEDCANADNLGGVFRNAAAFGVDGVLLSPGSGDPLYRKAIRTSMAASFLVPFVRAREWPATLDVLKHAGFTIVAMTPQQPSRTLAAFARDCVPERVAVLVGSEGEGLSEAALLRADVRVRIPMAASFDSLNVAVACGIALSRLSRVAHSDTT
jgi:tRNA G18 (ribose-2'-O)-methylase SpoU